MRVVNTILLTSLTQAFQHREWKRFRRADSYVHTLTRNDNIPIPEDRSNRELEDWSVKNGISGPRLYSLLSRVGCKRGEKATIYNRS